MFKQTNPDDNPQEGDDLRNEDGSRVAPPVQGPGDRPYGLTGVDKPHGGGNMESEAMADTRVPAGVVDRRRPSPNPNNPQDPNNPFSTSQTSDMSLAREAGVNTQPAGHEVATGAMKTKNEDDEDARRKAAVQSAQRAGEGGDVDPNDPDAEDKIALAQREAQEKREADEKAKREREQSSKSNKSAFERA